MSAPDAAPLPTRQQLDEIDILLRRMLSLPSMNSEVPAAPVVRETTPPGETPVQSWRVEWPQPAAAPPPSVAAWGTPAATAPPPPPWTNNMPSPTVQYAVPPAAAPVPMATAVSPLRVSPLVVLNGTYDLLTHLLGPLGGWFRDRGRTYMGWGGILMIAAAVAWAAGNWLGYEWPRLPGR